MKTVLAIIASIALSGCAMSNGSTNIANSNAPTVDYAVTWLSVFWGGNGTIVPITKDLSITAAHVAKESWLEVVAYNDKCDIAIVKHDNADADIRPLGKVYRNNTIETYGKNLLGMTIHAAGIYSEDVRITQRVVYRRSEQEKMVKAIEPYPYADCTLSIGEIGIYSGMSGGGVYNMKGELVGINSSVVSQVSVPNGGTYKDVALFVSLNAIAPWIKQVTGLDVQ